MQQDIEKDIEEIAALLKAMDSEREVAELRQIADSASARRYYSVRFTDGARLIATIGETVRENEAFIYLSRHFGSLGFSVPEVLVVSEDKRAYLQTDAGERSLYTLLTSGKEQRREVFRLALKAVGHLPALQMLGAAGLDWQKCYPVEAVTPRSRRWDLNYFKYDFLKVAGVEIDDALLEDEFDRLEEHLADPRIPLGFQVRDFQTRNIMVDKDGKLTLIDFQGGRKGNVIYDLVSLAWQTRAKFTADERNELASCYLKSLTEYVDIDKATFDRLLSTTLLFRQLQVLGAYGLRGIVQRKSGFAEMIEATVTSILEREEVAEQYPYLYTLLKEALVSVRKNAAVEPFPEGMLTVDVMSFSYKKGYPVDTSGNGGGFVFDCRWMANPGRYDEYKQLTGRDEPVIEFLNAAGECDDFVRRIGEVVFPAVEAYMKRGFTHLSVAFGCTGGRHRSLRCADLFAQSLRSRYGKDYPLRIRLTHREQGITEL